MVRIRKKKCCHCKELFLPDPRNAKRQKFCTKPACRKASKSASQRKWLQKPENIGYFKGPISVKRVQQWRKDHPGYWRPKPKIPANALQDPLNAKLVENKEDTAYLTTDALQDSLIVQPTVLLGLIANFTGSALQDDIAMTVRRLQQLGQDILNHSPQSKGGKVYYRPARSCDEYLNPVKASRYFRSNFLIRCPTWLHFI